MGILAQGRREEGGGRREEGGGRREEGGGRREEHQDQCQKVKHPLADMW